MKIPIRLLNIARCGASGGIRFNLDRMKLGRLDGFDLAMASDGHMAIVSATKTEEVTYNDFISSDDAALAIDMAAATGVDIAEVLPPSMVHVGRIRLCRKPSEGRFPDLLDETAWTTLSDDKALSFVVDIERLRKLLSILEDAMPDGARGDIVMTMPHKADDPIVFTAMSSGEWLSASLATMGKSVTPSWNPSDLKRPDEA